MATAGPRTLYPETPASAAAELAAATAAGERVRICGGATKLGWGDPGAGPDAVLSTARLDATLEHNAGDLTAVVQAGVPLARLQDELAASGQMLALDPPLHFGERDATVGGVIATGDSGPLSHRYGRARDLVLGVEFALADGTIARAGGKVIKNVAGYDLGKLFCGAFGTLGLILSVSLRLHPLPSLRVTALGASADPDMLTAAAAVLAASPLELEALDVAWRGGRGGLLAACAGAEAHRRAVRAATLMRSAGLDGVDVVDDDAGLWARQRAGQRSDRAALVRVCARSSQLAGVLRAADHAGATFVGRAGSGTGYLELEPGTVASLRGELASSVPKSVTMLLDAPARCAARFRRGNRRRGPRWH